MLFLFNIWDNCLNAQTFSSKILFQEELVYMFLRLLFLFLFSFLLYNFSRILVQNKINITNLINLLIQATRSEKFIWNVMKIISLHKIGIFSPNLTIKQPLGRWLNWDSMTCTNDVIMLRSEEFEKLLWFPVLKSCFHHILTTDSYINVVNFLKSKRFIIAFETIVFLSFLS